MRHALIIAFVLAAPAAAQDLTAERRADLLSFYPCGGALDDGQLAYLADWANATKRDPCQLGPQDFTASFGAAPTAFDALLPGGGEAGVLRHVEAWFRQQRPWRLHTYQVLLLGPEAADGAWGPQTEAVFARWVATYEAVGGNVDEGAVRGPKDVPRLLDWIEAFVFAEATGGEVPD